MEYEYKMHFIEVSSDYHLHWPEILESLNREGQTGWQVVSEIKQGDSNNFRVVLMRAISR